MDKSKIEDIAVDAVNMYISEKTVKLSGKLVKGDTGISVDGEIIHFSDVDRKVSTYGGSIPVQVKGTEVNSISEKVTAYRKFNLSTFENFLKLNGVLVFVVEEVFYKGKVRDKQIFYKYLDVPILVEIIENLIQSGNTYRTIYCDKLTEAIDFDDEIEEIRIQRAIVTPGLALYKAKANGTKASGTLDLKDFVEIVDGVSKEIKNSEFYDETSEFLKQVIPQVNHFLSQNFIFDFETSVLIATAFTENDKYNLLQPNMKNKILIFIAKVCNYRKDYDEAVSWLKKVDSSYEIDEYAYKREKFIATCSSISLDEANCLIDEWENSSDSYLYNLFFKIENNMVTFNELDKVKKNADTDDLLYLLGIGFSNIGKFTQASECYEKIKGNMNVQILKIINYFRSVVDEILLEGNQKAVQVLKSYEYELKGYLDKLSGKKLILSQGTYVQNLIKSIVEPKEFSDDELGISKEHDTLVIQSMLMIEDFDQVITYLHALNELDNSMFFFLMVAYQRKKDFKGIITEVESRFDKNSNLPEDTIMLLKYFYVESVIQTKDLERINHLIIENNLTEGFLKSRLLSFKLKECGKLTNEELKLVKTRFNQVNDEKEIQILNEIVFNFDDIEFTKLYWRKLKSSYADLIVEVVCTKLLKKGEEDNLLYLLEVSKWYQSQETSKKTIVTYELQAYYLLEQYKAIINRVNGMSEPSINAQNLRLISKIEINDSTDIDEILEAALATHDHDLTLNAAIGYIRFEVDPVLGSKLLLREIIESGFKDEEIGKNYVMQRFIGFKNLDDEKDLSKVSGKKLFYYELMNGKNRQEIITIPKDWEYPSNEKIRSIRSNTKEYILLLRASVGSTIKLGKTTYRITKKIPLSQYAHNRMLPATVGSPSSNKPLKKLNVSGENLSEVIEYIERDNVQKKEILEMMQTHGFTGFIQYLSGYDEIFGNLATLFNDKGFVYQLGEVNPPSLLDTMQLSISSMVFLENYGLQDIIIKVPNLFIDVEIQKHIKQSLERELEQGYEITKLGVYGGQPYITERTEEDFQKLLDFLTELLEITETVPNLNEATFIHPEYKKYLDYDASSFQSAIDNEGIFLIEDTLVQKYYNGVSILGLIHEIFIHCAPDIERYLDLLIRLEEDNNSYQYLNETIFFEIISAVIDSDEPTLDAKLDNWLTCRIRKNSTK